MKSISDSLDAIKKGNKILKEKYDIAIKMNNSLKYNTNKDFEDIKDMLFDLDCRVIQN